jgi:hypothetical protein
MTDTPSSGTVTLDQAGVVLCGRCGCFIGDVETHDTVCGSGGGPSIPAAALVDWVESLSGADIEEGITRHLGSLDGGAETTGDAVKAWLLEEFRRW